MKSCMKLLKNKRLLYVYLSPLRFITVLTVMVQYILVRGLSAYFFQTMKK